MSKTTEQFGAEIANALRAISPDGKLWDADVGPLNQLADSFWRRQPADGFSQGANFRLVDAAPQTIGGYRVSPAAFAIIKEFEGYARALPDGRCQAYPDPGSGGDPWTIGFGSTGPGIAKGVIWPRRQAEERLEADVIKFAAGVAKRLEGGAATSQGEFDAMVSLAYNVGLGNFESSTLLRKHKAGDKAGAAAEFAKWNKASGRVMAGLTRRREAEARLYRGQA